MFPPCKVEMQSDTGNDASTIEEQPGEEKSPGKNVEIEFQKLCKSSKTYFQNLKHGPQLSSQAGKAILMVSRNRPSPSSAASSKNYQNIHLKMFSFKGTNYLL